MEIGKYTYGHSIVFIERKSKIKFSYISAVYNDADVVVGYDKHSGHLQNDAIDGILWIRDESITISQADYMQFEAKRVLLPTITEDQLRELLTPMLSADSGKMPF